MDVTATILIVGVVAEGKKTYSNAGRGISILAILCFDCKYSPHRITVYSLSRCHLRIVWSSVSGRPGSGLVKSFNKLFLRSIVDNISYMILDIR